MFESIIMIAFKIFFMLKCIKIIFFLFFKKLFLKSAYQNNPKHTKKIIFNKKNWFFLKHELVHISKHVKKVV